VGSLGRCRAEASREDVGMRRYVFSRSAYPGRARTGRISIGRSSAEGYREWSHSGRVAGALAGYAGRGGFVPAWSGSFSERISRTLTGPRNL